MNETIRIVIADDHPIVRDGLRTAIGRSRSIEIIGEAGDGAQALRLARDLRPDVCVLDVDMPGISGFDVARELIADEIGAAIIFLTVHREPEMLESALGLGAKGFVLKDSATTEIVAGIAAVARGDFYTSPAMTSYLVGRRKTSTPPAGVATLTASERKVLKLLADYKTNKEIAAELHVSPRTVETHRKNVAAKLGLHGSHALMKFALTHRDEL